MTRQNNKKNQWHEEGLNPGHERVLGGYFLSCWGSLQPDDTFNDKYESRFYSDFAVHTSGRARIRQLEFRVIELGRA